MSTFDKLVASWVSSANSRPREERERILSSISKSMETYRELENPVEARARREEQKRKEEEARQREAEIRRASLPPRPPPANYGVPASRGSTRPLDGPSHPSPSATPVKGSVRPAAGAAPPPAAAPRALSTTALQTKAASAARVGRARARTSTGLSLTSVDYSFEEDVSVALRKLREGETGSLSGSHHRSQRRVVQRSSVKARKSAAATQGGNGQLSKPITPARSLAGGKGGDGPSPAGEGALRDSHEPSVAGSASRGKPPALAMLQQDDEDAEQLRADVAREGAEMELFAFGAKYNEVVGEGEEGDDDVPDFAETRAGGGDEDVPLDDEVDARRRQDQQKRPSRLGISDASLNLEEARLASFPLTPKSRTKVQIITKALERHYLFSFLDDGDIALFASIMDLENFSAGDDIIVKGEANDTLFLVLDGEAEATVEGTASHPAEEEVLPIGKGNTFGDIGLMYEARNTVTVRAKTDLQCASLERKTYKLVTSRSMAARRECNMQFVKELPIFHSLSAADVEQVAEALKPTTYAKGARVITSGSPVEWLHIVAEGTLEVVGRNGQHIATVERGGCVGHLELLFHHVAVSDVVAMSDVVKTVKLSRHQFNRLATAAHAPMMEEVAQDPSFDYYRQTMSGEDAPAMDTTRNAGAPPSYVTGSASQ